MIWNVLAAITCTSVGAILYKEKKRFLAGVNLTLGIVNGIFVICELIGV